MKKQRKQPTTNRQPAILRTILTEAKTPAKTIQKTNWHQKTRHQKNGIKQSVTHYRVLKEHTPRGVTVKSVSRSFPRAQSKTATLFSGFAPLDPFPVVGNRSLRLGLPTVPGAVALFKSQLRSEVCCSLRCVD